MSYVGWLSVQSVFTCSDVFSLEHGAPLSLSLRPPAAIGRLLVPPHPKPAIRRGLRITPPADSAASGFLPVCFSHTNHDTILPFRDCRPPIGQFVGRLRVNSALAAAHRPLPMLCSCSFSPQACSCMWFATCSILFWPQLWFTPDSSSLLTVFSCPVFSFLLPFFAAPNCCFMFHTAFFNNQNTCSQSSFRPGPLLQL